MQGFQILKTTDNEENMGDCPVCCDKFNKAGRAPVTCECADCDFTACKECTRTYLLSVTSDPDCMSCHKAWSQRFLASALNQSFMTTTYRTHRSKVLAERERARLQDSVQDAQRQLEAESLDKDIQIAQAEVGRLKVLLKEAERDRSRLAGRRYAITRGYLDGGEQEEEKRHFIMPCPAEGCRGFLSTGWKCGLCGIHACKDCFEAIGFRKTDPHTCNPDSVASAEAIRKETRPCPACGIRIYKIHGCDQMWCTQCKVAFSWRTGKKSAGVVHNPHYLEWQRSVREGGDAVRAPGDAVCGGLIGYYEQETLRRKVNAANDMLLSSTTAASSARSFRGRLGFCPGHLVCAVGDMYRVIAQIVNVDLPRYRENIAQLEDTGPIRVQYLLKRIDEKQMEKLVFSQDAKRRKTLQVLHILELVGAVGTETFNEMSLSLVSAEDPLRERIKSVIEMLGEHTRLPSGSGRDTSACWSNWRTVLRVAEGLERLERLFEYCNSQLAHVSTAFSLSVHTFKMDAARWRYPTCESVPSAPYSRPANNPVYDIVKKKYGVHAAAALSQTDGATENVKI